MRGHAVSSTVDKTNTVTQLCPNFNNRIFILLAQLQLLLWHLVVRIYLTYSLTDKQLHLLDEDETNPRHDHVRSIQTIQTIYPRYPILKHKIRLLTTVYLVSIPINAKKVLIRCEKVKMVVDEPINNCMHRVFFVFDLLVEVVVYVLLLGHRLLQIIVVSLYQKWFTFDRSRYDSRFSESKLISTSSP